MNDREGRYRPIIARFTWNVEEVLRESDGHMLALVEVWSLDGRMIHLEVFDPRLGPDDDEPELEGASC